MSAGRVHRSRITSNPSSTPATVPAINAVSPELSQTNGRTVETTSTASADSIPAPAEVAYASNGGTVAGAPVPAAPTRPEVRVARTWTHVRKAPRKGAELEAVLTPGDTVLADSLQRGWYRVALDGEVLGYAYQSTLEAADSTARGAVTP